MQRVAFESFRDLVKLTRRGLSDEEGLAFMEDEALNLRVAARTRASASAGLHVAGAAQAAPDALFGPAEAEAGGEEGADAAEDEMIESVATGAEALDAAGAAFGIATFSAQLQRAVVQEEEEAEASEFVKKPCAALPARCAAHGARIVHRLLFVHCAVGASRPLIRALALQEAHQQA